MSSGLIIGDEIEFDSNGRKSIHTIVGRKLTAETRSGVSYRLLPADSQEWVDADQVRKAKGFGRNASRKVDPFEIAASEVNQ